MATTFTLNNAGPGDVLIIKGVAGTRYKVTTFGLIFSDTNGVQFRSGLAPAGPTISGLMVGLQGGTLTPANTGGFKNFLTDAGAPLVLTITGSGTITGDVTYDTILPPV